jgi:hypothetical protein
LGINIRRYFKMLKYILLIVVIAMIVPVLRPYPTHAKLVSECKIDEKPGDSGITREEANNILQIESLKCICIEDGIKDGKDVLQAGILAAGECVAVAEKQACSSNPLKACCILFIDFKCPKGGYTGPDKHDPNPNPMEMVEWAITKQEPVDATTVELQLAE